MENESWVMVSERISMRDYLGGDWRYVHKVLHGMQGDVMEVMPEIPLTGQFISYRGSMMNWCPIGREAGPEDRRIFENLDENLGVRMGLLVTLRDRLSSISKKLTVKLGGSTSFDIYPQGWDKSYVLRRFSDGETIWFIGDRCDLMGNDHEIYEALKPFGRAFKVGGPDETPHVIYDIMGSLGVADDRFYCPPY
jgi:hypothetical protein